MIWLLAGPADFNNAPPHGSRNGRHIWHLKGGHLARLPGFGDGWHHTITVERISNVPSDHYVEISCLEGKRACPPEDVGGPSGYAGYLKAMSSRRHPDHEDMLRWRGEFDPEEFAIEEVNRELAKLVRWSRGRKY
jgi:hypothetical protein